MTISNDSFEQVPSISDSLRAALQSSVAEPHQILERIPLMQRYARGGASDKEYMAVTRTMLAFWAGYTPATHDLPVAYSRFFESYLASLRVDTGARVPAEPAEAVDEVAFYYVLLGSGLGAKVILRNNVSNDFSKHNLLYLSQYSTPLWKDFNQSHLSVASPARWGRIKMDSRHLFDALLDKIQKIAQEIL